MIHRPIHALAALLLVLSGPAGALTLEFAGEATQTGARVERMTSYRMPVGPFAAGAIEARLVEGALEQTAWVIEAEGRTTLELLLPLRQQLTRAGFKVVYECEAVECGGFDFRYGTEVLPEPDMHVDLGDFRYLAAELPGTPGPEVLSLIVSRAGDRGFVQVIRAGHAGAPLADMQTVEAVQAPQEAQAAQADTDPPPEAAAEAEAMAYAPPAAGSLAARLTTGGAQVLPDLVFDSGAAALLGGDYASLAELAAFLRANPQAQVMLVGHTDASGGLQANISLSRERARSVRQRLLTGFDIPARQVVAEGVGYLAPRAPNDTEAGRLANRRVEVMLLAPGG